MPKSATANPSPPQSTKETKTPHIHKVVAFFEDDFETRLQTLAEGLRPWVKAQGFSGKTASLIVIPDQGQGLLAWFGLGAKNNFDPFCFRALGAGLPSGHWQLEADACDVSPYDIHLAFGLGQYRYETYKKTKSPQGAVLDRGGLKPKAVKALDAALAAHHRARDMINCPAEDMGPQHIAALAQDIAKSHKAQCRIVEGEALLKANYPLIHAVGRAASPDRAPILIEIDWVGDPKGPLIVLIGKGVAFDTGGLDLKPSVGMALMKKDMGGAAHALSLGEWIMRTGLKIRLKILVAAVENAVSGNAFRPGDIFMSRAGLSVEIGNTDAEGRLILADCLTRAAEENPDLTLDFATLTGAARVALGPQLVPFYCDDESLSKSLMRHSHSETDPLWPMPLWAGYEEALNSDIADLRNDAAAWAQAGSVTAALFLRRFAPKSGQWAHFDLFGWNPKARPGYPVGAEAQVLRAVFRHIENMK